MSSSKNSSPLKIVFGTSIIIALFASVFFFKPPSPLTTPTGLQAVLWPEPRQLVAFNLTQKDQQPFSLDNLSDRWTLLFFGYTSCPDVCPMALSAMKAIYESLEKYPDIQKKTQIVFVSVDPSRDTPEHINKYVSHFNKNFIGATGEVAEIDKMTRQFAAGYIIEEAKESGSYDINHTSSFYLIGPGLRVHGAFNSPHLPDTIVSQYLDILKLRDNQQ